MNVHVCVISIFPVFSRSLYSCLLLRPHHQRPGPPKRAAAFPARRNHKFVPTLLSTCMPSLLKSFIYYLHISLSTSTYAKLTWLPRLELSLSAATAARDWPCPNFFNRENCYFDIITGCTRVFDLIAYSLSKPPAPFPLRTSFPTLSLAVFFPLSTNFSLRRVAILRNLYKFAHRKTENTLIGCIGAKSCYAPGKHTGDASSAHLYGSPGSVSVWGWSIT